MENARGVPSRIVAAIWSCPRPSCSAGNESRSHCRRRRVGAERFCRGFVDRGHCPSGRTQTIPVPSAPRTSVPAADSSASFCAARSIPFVFTSGVFNARRSCLRLPASRVPVSFARSSCVVVRDHARTINERANDNVSRCARNRTLRLLNDRSMSSASSGRRHGASAPVGRAQSAANIRRSVERRATADARHPR